MDKENRILMFGGAGLVLLVIAIIVFFWGCYSIIDVGHIGIKIHLGQVTGQVGSGVYIHDPLTSITQMSVQTQRDDVQASAATKDLQQLNTSVVTNFHLTSKTAFDVFRNVGTDYFNVVVAPDIQQAIKENTAKYNASELVDNRAVIQQAIETDIANKLGPIGVTVDNLSITDFGFSDTYNQAVENKAKAQQDALTAQYELTKAQLNAQAQQVQATTLTPDYLELQAIQKWDGHLPTALGANNVFGIPISK